MDEASEILQNVESNPQDIEGEFVMKRVKSIFEEIKKDLKRD
jgi:hypothetical protein